MSLAKTLLRHRSPPPRMVHGDESRIGLLRHLIAHEVRRRYAGTILGPAWAVIEPLMVLSAFFFLFTVLRVTKHAPHGPLGEVAIILSGLVPWYFFIRSFTEGLNTLDQHAPLVKQINFPVEVLPFVAVGVSLIEFGIGLVLVLGLAIAEGWTGWHFLVLVPMILLQGLGLVGMAAILAPLGTMLRDLRQLLPLIVRLGLWTSPVLYLPGLLSQKLKWIIYANPLSYFIELFRYGAFGKSLSPHTLFVSLPLTFGIAAGITAVLAVGGVTAWGYVRRVAVDYL